jgi:hypothetical protein
VDQSPDGRFAPLFERADSGVEILVPTENLGYSSACNWLRVAREPSTYCS